MQSAVFCARRLISSNLGWFLKTRETIGEAAGRERAININRDVFAAWFPELEANSKDPIEITTRYLVALSDESIPSTIHSDQRTIRRQGGGKNWRLAGDAIKDDFYDVRMGDLLIMSFDAHIETLSWVVLKGNQATDRRVSQQEINAHSSVERVFGPDIRNMWLLTSEQKVATLEALSGVYQNIEELLGDSKGGTKVNQYPAVLRSFSFNPDTVIRGKKYTEKTIALRMGQPAFRRVLLDAYNSKCAISKVNVLNALEAAHIIPYSGEETNNIRNGILLRSDIHTLFDKGLLCIDPTNYSVKISSQLKNTYYAQFDGTKVYLPVRDSERPSLRALAYHIKHTFQG